MKVEDFNALMIAYTQNVSEIYQCIPFEAHRKPVLEDLRENMVKAVLLVLSADKPQRPSHGMGVEGLCSKGHKNSLVVRCSTCTDKAHHARVQEVRDEELEQVLEFLANFEGSAEAACRMSKKEHRQ